MIVPNPPYMRNAMTDPESNKADATRDRSASSASERPLHTSDLDRRSREIFRTIVESYLDTGEAVGSRTISRTQGVDLSPASIRNTMQDLVQMGLLAAPHASAGRLPTQAGLRLFVDGLLEVGDLAPTERAEIETRVSHSAASVDTVLERASTFLSGLAGGAGLVVTPTQESALRHVEFVALSADEALAVVVFEDGHVENRIITPPPGVTPAALVEAGNYLSNRVKGHTFSDARVRILRELEAGKAQLDVLAEGLIKIGLASWSGDGTQRALIVRGASNLLENIDAATDLERIRLLFDDIERKEDLITLLDQARDAQGVRIFIGAENPLFSLSGSSVVAAPYMNAEQRVVGALGVIGPTRLNYAKVIPLVDYTARVVGRLLDNTDDKSQSHGGD